jgi:hypothetical protein
MQSNSAIFDSIEPRFGGGAGGRGIKIVGLVCVTEIEKKDDN